MLANSISSWKLGAEHQASGEMQNKNKNSVWIMKPEVNRFNRFFLAQIIDVSHWKLVRDLFCLVWYCKWCIFLSKSTDLGFSLISSWVAREISSDFVCTELGDSAISRGKNCWIVEEFQFSNFYLGVVLI